MLSMLPRVEILFRGTQSSVSKRGAMYDQ